MPEYQMTHTGLELDEAIEKSLEDTYTEAQVDEAIAVAVAAAVALLPSSGTVVATPEGSVTAVVGSTRIDRTTVPGSTVIWYKQTGSGNTGWQKLTELLD